MIMAIEQNLYWLQNMYMDRTKLSGFILPNNIIGTDIIDSYNLSRLPLTPGLLKIDTLDNPGWILKFAYNDTAYYNNAWNDLRINLEIEDNNDWMSVIKKPEYFDLASGPLYLSLCLEAFRCWIEQIPFHIDDLSSAREKIKAHNPLLCWLEEMYYGCCNGDWEHLCGYSIISTQEGWVAAFSVENLIGLEDKQLEKVLIEEPEGTIECYKKDYSVILRTHHKGLIKGIQIFKDWVDEVDAWRI